MAGIGETLWLTFIYVGWWLIPILFLFIYRFRLQKYPIECTIYEKRGDDLIWTRDVCGRFTNPVEAYKLKRAKDTIPIPKYDWVLQAAYKPTNLFERISNLIAGGKVGHLTLFKYGSKQYKPINVKEGERLVKKFKPIKNKDGSYKYVTVYEVFDPKKAMTKIEFEVIDWDDINHLTQELRAIATRRSPAKQFFEKYAAPLGIAVAVVALIIGGYYYQNILLDAGSKYSAITGSPSNPTPPASTSDTPLGNFIPGK